MFFFYGNRNTNEQMSHLIENGHRRFCTLHWKPKKSDEWHLMVHACICNCINCLVLNYGFSKKSCSKSQNSFTRQCICFYNLFRNYPQKNTSLLSRLGRGCILQGILDRYGQPIIKNISFFLISLVSQHLLHQ